MLSLASCWSGRPGVIEPNVDAKVVDELEDFIFERASTALGPCFETAWSSP
jgi:hypothetical protein